MLTTSRVKWAGLLFDIQQGVRQGGVLSTSHYKRYNNPLLLHLEDQYTVELRWLKFIRTVGASSTHPCVRVIPGLTIFKLVHVYFMSSWTTHFSPTTIIAKSMWHLSLINNTLRMLELKYKLHVLAYVPIESKYIDQLAHMRRLINAFAIE